MDIYIYIYVYFTSTYIYIHEHLLIKQIPTMQSKNSYLFVSLSIDVSSKTMYRTYIFIINLAGSMLELEKLQILGRIKTSTTND